MLRIILQHIHSARNAIMSWKQGIVIVGCADATLIGVKTMDDLISRQAAITVANYSDYVGLSVDDVKKVTDEVVKGLKQLPSAQQWIPCSERLPDNRVCVIVCFREWQQYAKRYIYSIVTGWYARKHSVREDVFSEWEADCDYDEDEDEYYIQEGWYEFTTQGNFDLVSWYINVEVVAWMPLPEPYQEATL